MAKRNAVTELNPDNWDQEDKSEKAGEFQRATDDQMKANKQNQIFLMNITPSLSLKCRNGTMLWDLPR